MIAEARFRALVEAYGAGPARWPAAERAAAQAFAAADPALAAEVLRGEGRLDALLDACATAPVTSALRDRIVSDAPHSRAKGGASRWWLGAGLALGLVSACAAGVVAGLTLTPASVTRMIGGVPREPADDVAALLAPGNEARGA
jgi:hypothetical protein